MRSQLVRIRTRHVDEPSRETTAGCAEPTRGYGSGRTPAKERPQWIRDVRCRAPQKPIRCGFRRTYSEGVRRRFAGSRASGERRRRSDAPCLCSRRWRIGPGRKGTACRIYSFRCWRAFHVSKIKRYYLLHNQILDYGYGELSLFVFSLLPGRVTPLTRL
jgi:hypothetical protein